MVDRFNESGLDGYPFPRLSDLSQFQYGGDENARFLDSVANYIVLVAYLLERVGFTKADYDDYAEGRPLRSVAVINSKHPQQAAKLLGEAWGYLDGFMPGAAAGLLLTHMKNERLSTPRWWLQQMRFIPFDENYESGFSRFWEDSCPHIIEDELPPWEVSQEAT